MSRPRANWWRVSDGIRTRDRRDHNPTVMVSRARTPPRVSSSAPSRRASGAVVAPRSRPGRARPHRSPCSPLDLAATRVVVIGAERHMLLVMGGHSPTTRHLVERGRAVPRTESAVLSSARWRPVRVSGPYAARPASSFALGRRSAPYAQTRPNTPQTGRIAHSTLLAGSRRLAGKNRQSPIRARSPPEREVAGSNPAGRVSKSPATARWSWALCGIAPHRCRVHPPRSLLRAGNGRS